MQPGIGGDQAGLARVRRGIAVATRIGRDDLVALGYLQIGSGYGEMRQYGIAKQALVEGIAFAEARELMWGTHEFDWPWKPADGLYLSGRGLHAVPDPA